ncbi:MAG: TPM domain-containing protein [Bryobacteraceae bacterium]|jgi:uncharacterized protein
MRSFLRLCCGLLCLVAPALAVDWKSLKPQGYVSDFAGVIDAQSRAAIDDYAARVEQATGAQLAFVTLPSLDGEPIEDVANDIFHAWGVGRKTEDDGAMLLLSVRDRKSRLEVGGGLGGIIPDSMAGLLLDDMRPALRAGQYGEAMLVAAQRLGGTIAQAKGVRIAAPAMERRVPRSTQDSIPWGMIFLGIFVLLMLLRGGGGTRYGGGGGGGFWSGLLLGSILNSGRGWSGGGRDGGGFGGFDSGGGGGGFGGFGGGDSGGGGASSDW